MFHFVGFFYLFNKQVNRSWVDKFLCSSCGIAFICTQANTSAAYGLFPMDQKKEGVRLCSARSHVEKQGRKTAPSTFLPLQNAFPAAGRARCVRSHESTLLPSGKAGVVQSCCLLHFLMAVIPVSPLIPETACFPYCERAFLLGLFQYLYLLRYVSILPFFFFFPRTM